MKNNNVLSQHSFAEIGVFSNNSQVSNWVNKIGVTVVGASVTFILFVFMAQLVKFDQVFIDKPTDAPFVQVVQDAPEPIVPHKIIRTKPPEPAVRPPVTAVPSNNTGEEFIINTELTPPPFTPSTEVYSQGPVSSEALPLVQIAPQYPINAARDGREGYVIVAFDINTVGGVINARVVEAEPKRIFDRSAIQAINGWKYKPKVEQGTAVMQSNQQVRLDFSLEKTQ